MKFIPLVTAIELLIFCSDAHARGGGGGYLLFLILFICAPLLLWLLDGFVVLSLTVIPIGIGIYMMIDSTRDGGFVFGLFLVVIGSATLWSGASKDQKERILKIFRKD